MNIKAGEVIARASRVDLCASVVIGIRPNGGGLYVDWSGETIMSLITLLEAAKAEAVATYLEGLKTQDLEAWEKAA
jgi:hypothetical protein